MELKILEYNILNGFCKNDPPFVINKKKMKAAIKIIKEQNPDILILTEAYFWPFAKKTNLKVIDKTFNELYNNYSKLAYKGFRWAPIILSKYPIINFDTSMSEIQFKFMRAKIKVKKKILTLDVFHPHPNTTEKQKENFLKPLIKDLNKKYILSGDFNALSPQDNYDKKKLIRGYENFMKNKGKSKVEDMLKSNSLKLILNNKLIDTYKEKNKNKFEFTVPTDLLSKNKDSASRIDYIFSSKDFKVINSGIIKNKLTERASDHYPIYTLLEF